MPETQNHLGAPRKSDWPAIRRVLDQARDCIKILEPQGRIHYINSEGRCALAIADPATACGKLWPELWPDESKPTIELALKKARSGESCEIEAARPNPAGETTWWRISVSPLKERDGRLEAILTISRDITAHVRLRESQQTLALEMRHRLRNAYTIASAIVMQSAPKDPQTQAFVESVCARLAHVALSQSRLIEAGDEDWTLTGLVRSLVGAHGDRSHAIRFQGSEDAAIDRNEATLVALVIGELTNNSLKYGALRQHREVLLSWTDEADHLTLNWVEPFLGADQSVLRARDSNSGYSMMQRLARSQGATFEHGIANGQLSVTLRLRKRRFA
jgi:PAS domain S-box-containing protein